MCSHFIGGGALRVSTKSGKHGIRKLGVSSAHPPSEESKRLAVEVVGVRGGKKYGARDVSAALPGPNIFGMRTAIFGGAFDPVTRGHLKQIQLLAGFSQEPDTGERFFQRVRVVVSGDGRPDKQNATPAKARLEMVKLALAANAAWFGSLEVICDDTEVRSERFVPTWELLELLQAAHAEEEHFVVIGEDQAWQVGDSWQRGAWLREHARFCVLPRAGFRRPAQRAHVVHFVAVPATTATSMDCSSSLCRDLLRRGVDTSAYLTDEVTRYLTEKGLYGTRQVQTQSSWTSSSSS